MKRQQGFTFAETLVVMAILMIVSAITFCALSVVKARAGQTTCASNLKSLYMAASIYQADHGDLTNAQTVSTMGFPNDTVDAKTLKPLFGAYEQWKCPAPKRTAQSYWPHYEYLLLSASAKGGNYLASAYERFGGALPLISDLNHNDHLTVSLYAPRVQKRVIYVNLQGQVVNKIVRRSFSVVADFSSFELDDSHALDGPGGSE